MSGFAQLLPQDWAYKTLPEVVSFIVDNRGKSVPTVDSGIPLIATNCISHDGLYPSYKNIRYVSSEVYDSWFRAHPEPGDVIFVNKGTPGLVCQVPKPVGFCFAQDMVALRPDTTVVDKNYLLAALRSPFFQEQVKAFSVGTTIPHMKKSDFSKLLVPVPPINQQKWIGRIYVSLSLKIEVNRRINRTLEAMAQALYQHWFVDFGPFQDGGLVESALGLIPAGWTTTTLREITTKIGSGATPQGGSNVYVDEGINLIRSQNVYDSSFSWDGLAYITDEAAEKLRTVTVVAGDILINITGDSILRTCVADEAVLPARVNQHVAIIRTVAEVPPHFVHQHLLRRETKEMLFNMSAGATRKAITKGNLESTPILRPPTKVLDAFRYKTDPFFAQIAINNSESRKLAEIRDYLLPKLLSGEIGVAADAAGAVTIGGAPEAEALRLIEKVR